MEKLNSTNRLLAKNTFFLYVMTISTYILNLITIPYLTRVLGPTIYGQIGLAVGYMSYIQIVLDFGFILSATQLISERRRDYKFASQIITSVALIKVGLALFILFGFGILFHYGFFEKSTIYLLSIYLLAYLCAALLPDFFYRGIENMKAISIRTVLIKIIFTILIFIFVKNERDVIFVPISQLCGNMFALFYSYFDLRKHYNIQLVLPNIIYIGKLIKVSIPFFVSRFASTFYQALDIIVLGKIYGMSPVVGYYSSSDKLIALAKTASSPIADSLYPYMLKNRNFKLVKKMMFIIMPIITVGIIFVAIFAEPICVLLFGVKYRETGDILRLLLPIAWIVLPNYVVAFPIMSPLGLVKYTNISNVIGMFIQVGGLIMLWFMNRLNIYSICILTSITEVLVFLYRVSIVIIYYKKRKR